MAFNKVLVTGMIIISLVFSVCISLLFEIKATYPTQNLVIDERYRVIFDKYATNELNLEINTSKSIIAGGEQNNNGFLMTAYPSVISTSKQLMGSADMFQTLIFQIPEIIPMNHEVIILLALLITSLSIFAFIYFIAGRSP